MTSEASERPNAAGSTQRVTVLGGGIIGLGLAALYALGGHAVRIYDPKAGLESQLTTMLASARTVMQQLGTLSDSPREPELTPDLRYALGSAGIVHEALPENLALKQNVLAEVESLCPQDTLLLSASSGLMPSQIQAKLLLPERFMIAHPCNPPYLMPVIELSPGEQTDRANVDRAEAIFRRLGKEVIRLQREVPGHLINRLQAALWREAVYLVQAGYASVGDIDQAVAQGLGARWAVAGPHKIFHFAGGAEGMAGFLDRLGPQVESWWQTLGTPVLDNATRETLVDGMNQAMAGRSLAEDARERDRKMAQILQLLASS